MEFFFAVRTSWAGSCPGAEIVFTVADGILHSRKVANKTYWGTNHGEVINTNLANFKPEFLVTFFYVSNANTFLLFLYCSLRTDVWALRKWASKYIGYLI